MVLSSVTKRLKEEVERGLMVLRIKIAEELGREAQSRGIRFSLLIILVDAV